MAVCLNVWLDGLLIVFEEARIWAKRKNNCPSLIGRCMPKPIQSHIQELYQHIIINQAFFDK